MTIRVNAKLVIKFNNLIIDDKFYQATVSEQVRKASDTVDYRDPKIRGIISGNTKDLKSSFETAYPQFTGALDALLLHVSTLAETAAANDTNPVP